MRSDRHPVNRYAIVSKRSVSLDLVEARSRKDGDGGSHEIQRKDPEAEAIDHHRRKLPVVRFLLVLQVVLHLLGNVSQLVQYRQQLTAHARRRHRVISVSGGRRAAVERPLEAGSAALDDIVVDRNGVVDVLDIRDEADRRRRLRLEVAHARFAL